jgi:Rrf2 family protein
MTNISQKCQYALRALLELSKRRDVDGATPASEIADRQKIPPRFLELILGQLKQGGYVSSRRGVQGGYTLVSDPEELTVGEIIRFMDGPLSPVKCIGPAKRHDCELQGRCAFAQLWERARDAVAEVYDQTSFQDLMEDDRSSNYTPDYVI